MTPPKQASWHYQVWYQPLLQEGSTMLGQVSSNHNEEFIKSIKIGDLSMSTNDIPVNDTNEPSLLQETYCPPERSFTTALLLGDHGFFRVHLTIIGPVPQQPEGYLPLSRGQAEKVLEALMDQVILLKQQLR